MLKSLPLYSRAPFFPRMGLTVHALLGGTGHSKETKPSYDWHGLKRGDGRFSLFQYTLAGEGVLRFEDREMRIHPGDLMLLTIPHDHRYYLPHDAKHWQFIYVILQGREPFRITRELVRRRGPVVKLPSNSPPIRIAIEICRAVQSNRIRDAYHSSELAYSFLMALTSHMTPAVGQEDTPVFISRVITFCENNFQKPIGVDDLAAESHYSRYHFSRLFKQWMGLSPGEYLQEVRLNQARTLLGETTARVKEIAFQSGFNDYNYFSRAFRKQFGQSPGAFRKNGFIRRSK